MIGQRQVQGSLAAAFERDGYVHLHDVIPPTDLEAIRAEYATELQARAGRWRERGWLVGGEVPRGTSFGDHLLVLVGQPGFDLRLLHELEVTLPFAPFSIVGPDTTFFLGQALLDLATRQALLDRVAELVGQEIVASPNQHCRLKPPELEAGPSSAPGDVNYRRTGWHQDGITHVEESDDTPVITCWVPMADVGVDDGCLVVVPGAHADRALLPWPVPTPIADRLDAEAVALPVRVGDVILLDKHLPHASLPNQGSGVRWSFDLRYHAADLPSDRPWFPSIVVRSSDESRVVRDVAEWRRRWDEARELLVASRQPVPGRPEHARMNADALIERWSRGDFPRLSLSS